MDSHIPPLSRVPSGGALEIELIQRKESGAVQIG
jgi:hypothetical protein